MASKIHKKGARIDALIDNMDKLEPKASSSNDGFMSAADKEKLNDLPNAEQLAGALGGKQDTIPDLPTIRSGAAAGATAYQKPGSGIPESDMSDAVKAKLAKAETALQEHQDISGKQDVIQDLSAIRSGAAAGDTAYQKPGTGIPESDMSDAVKAKLAKAESALQEHQDISGKQDVIPDLATIRSGAGAGATAYQKPGTGIPEADMSDGVKAKLAKAETALQEHQDISGKQDVIQDLAAIRSGAAAGGTAYQKPGTGIPASDLSSEVQDMIENGGKTKSVSVNGGTPVTPDANGLVDLTIEQANVTIGTITTGAAGSDADVHNSGTPTSPVLDFVIPRGQTGQTGPQGPMGESVIVGQGDLPLTHVTGQSTEKAMSQKGVTDALFDEAIVKTKVIDVDSIVDTVSSSTSTSGPVPTDYGNANKGKWISNNTYNAKSNAVMFMMPRTMLEDSDKLKITAQTYSRIAFLKNNTAGNGNPAPYCDGTSMMTLQNNAVEILDIPEDCNYIYFDYSYDGVLRLPSEIKGFCTVKPKLLDIEAKIEVINSDIDSAKIMEAWDVDVEDIIDTIDSGTSGGSSLETDYGTWHNGKFINGTYSQYNAAQMFMMPRAILGKADVLEIVARSVTKMAFLKSNSATIGATPSYCDGCELIDLRNTTVRLEIPKDCKYIYFDYKYDGVMRFPKEIKCLVTFKGQVNKNEAKIDSIYSAMTCTKLTGERRARKITPAMTVVEGYSYVFPVTPCQKIFIAGAANFVWLKASYIQLGSDPFDASNYFQGWCECDNEGATLYAAPDAHYIAVEGVDGDVDLYAFEEYKDFEAHGTDLLSLAAYVANRSLRYMYHTYIRTMHGGGYKSALTGIGSDNENSHRVPAALASQIEMMLHSDKLDLGLIGTTKYALRNQVIRYVQAVVSAHSSWANKWQSSLTANSLANCSCRMYQEGYMSAELYNSVLDVLIAEANNILAKNVGDRWADNHVFGLYWKNANGTELYNGDSKSEEVGWYGGCLGSAYALCSNAPNWAIYKNKFIEFAIISHAAPSDIGVDKSINGYSLANLQGSNITDDGIIINHQIIHPDYMYSRTSCIFSCLRALISAGLKIPRALLFNTSLVLHGFIDYEFTSEKYLGKYQTLPPYGVIIADGADKPYFPMGNDWGTVRQTAEISYLADMYVYRQSPRYDCTQSAIAYLMTIKKLQDRFETTSESGKIIADSSENSYGGNSTIGNRYANVASTMVCATNIVNRFGLDIVWTDEALYSNN